MRRLAVLLLMIVTTTAIPGLGQVAPSAGIGSTNGTASIPDFSGIWFHPYWPGFEPPASGAGPVTNLSRLPGGPEKGVSNPLQLAGDYRNPILKSQAADVLKARGESELRGVGSPTPVNQCWPDGVPLILFNFRMQMLQGRDEITILYGDYQFRQVHLNRPHAAGRAPSWYGDSIGHYEGDTLVIDTAGIKVGRFAMVDMYGTPHTESLHVVERYRLVDDGAAQEALQRNAKENFLFPQGVLTTELDTNYRGKRLQVEITVEDPGVFTTPWSETITYGRPLDSTWAEYICSENPRKYYAAEDTPVPRADSPDF